jgi:hypothetical protein
VATLKTWIDYLEGINKNEHEEFFKPIQEGKWSKAAIITHIMFWDRFFYQERLPHMLKGENLVGITADQVEEMNKEADLYAHSGKSLQELINEAVKYRQKIIDALQDKDLSITFTIRDKKISLNDYINGEAEHDEHHLKQLQVM